MPYDVIIVGGGLAGACAALWLSRANAVLLLEAGRPAGGASGAAAGLVNPFKGLRATPMWRHEQALVSLHATLNEANSGNLFRATGVVRPALDAQQAERFEKAALTYPSHLDWLSAKAASNRYPDVSAAFGALWVPGAGAISLSGFTEAMLKAAAMRGSDIRSGVRMLGWEESATACLVKTDGGSFEAKTLVLCLGDGFSAFPELAALPLHKVKGQTIRLARPPGLSPALPAVSAGIYVVPEGNEFVVGSTFEHAFENLDPDRGLSLELRNHAAALIPALADASIVDERAGIRVTVPRVRLPLLGPLTGLKRVWIFTALGAKGLMTAPLLARDLPGFLADTELLPREVRLPEVRLM